MKKTKSGALAVAAGLAFAALGMADPAAAQVRLNHEYAVKVICGNMERAADRPLATGRYFTIVNIHNPHVARVYFRRKVAQAALRTPSPISPWEQYSLEYDEALGVNCAQITKQAGPDWVEGFVIIQASKPLDVVAVYSTSGGNEYVNTFHTERVQPRLIE
jgi:hypothetical protein